MAGPSPRRSGFGRAGGTSPAMTPRMLSQQAHRHSLRLDLELQRQRPPFFLLASDELAGRLRRAGAAGREAKAGKALNDLLALEKLADLAVHALHDIGRNADGRHQN